MSPNDAQFARSIAVHEPSFVLATGSYSQDKESVHPVWTGTQLLSFVFAFASKLKALASVHPYKIGMHALVSFTFATGLKLYDNGSMQPVIAI